MSIWLQSLKNTVSVDIMSTGGCLWMDMTHWFWLVEWKQRRRLQDSSVTEATVCSVLAQRREASAVDTKPHQRNPHKQWSSTTTAVRPSVTPRGHIQKTESLSGASERVLDEPLLPLNVFIFNLLKLTPHPPAPRSSSCCCSESENRRMTEELHGGGINPSRPVREQNLWSSPRKTLLRSPPLRS